MRTCPKGIDTICTHSCPLKEASRTHRHGHAMPAEEFRGARQKLEWVVSQLVPFYAGLRESKKSECRGRALERASQASAGLGLRSYTHKFRCRHCSLCPA